MKTETVLTAVCPKCGNAYSGHPALSRPDNETLICPDYGVREALGSIGVLSLAHSVIAVERTDDIQHIADGTLTFDRLELRLLLMPSLGAFLCRRFLGFGLIHFRMSIPVEIMLFYVLEVFHQATTLDALIVIPWNEGLLIRREDLGVLVV